MTELEAVKRATERISPEEWLKRREENPSLTQKSRFIPPRTGSSHFGVFEVERENPYFEVLDRVKR